QQHSLWSFLYLHCEVGDCPLAGHQNLVTFTRRNVNDIARPQLISSAPIDRGTMNASWHDRLSTIHHSASRQRSATVENVEHNGDVCMQLNVAAPATNAEHRGMLRVLLQGLAGRAVSQRDKLTQVRCSLQQDHKWPMIHRALAE